MNNLSVQFRFSPLAQPASSRWLRLLLALAVTATASCRKPAGRLYQKCAADTECGKGELCRDGLCKTSADLCAGVSCAPGLVCAAGQCYPASCAVSACSASEVCVAEACLSINCVGRQCPDGQACSDGLCVPQEQLCAHVTCGANTKCIAGTCYALNCPSATCRTDEVCVKDECLQESCVGRVCPDGKRCASGTCEDADCVAQGVACGNREFCRNGECVPVACGPVSCPSGYVCGSDQGCWPEGCGTACGSHELCYHNTCVDRLCVGISCTGGAVCVAGDCYQPDCVSPCPSTQVCVQGTCQDIACVGDRCCPKGSCTLANQCETQLCLGQAYRCAYDAGTAEWSTTSTTCSDGSACTQIDICQDGACVGANPVVCPSDDCHDPGTCNPQNGACSAWVAKTGTPCDDDNLCTQTDACQNGTCTGTNPVVCTPDQCHNPGTCNPADGQCSVGSIRLNLSCSDGDLCTYGDKCNASAQCVGTTAPCADDPPPCGVHRPCNGTASCALDYPADTTPCDAGRLGCTSGDHCNGSGGCTPGSTVADGTLCTVSTMPDYDWDICVNGFCVSPGTCTSNACNPPAWPTFTIPDTGVKQCFDTTQPIVCQGTAGSASCGDTPWCGQDGQYGWDVDHDKTVDRFYRDTSDAMYPVVTDLVTGLIWQGCSTGQTTTACTPATPTGLNYQAAVGYCDSLVWAGVDDWRLPSMFELYTLVDWTPGVNPSINKAVFPNTVSDYYWSITNAGSGGAVYVLRAYYGDTALPGKGNLYQVRCVRGKPPPSSAPRFTRWDAAVSPTVQPVVLDAMTGLIWQGCAADKDGTICENGSITTSRDWAGAMAYCENLLWGTKNDWRLPNMQELMSVLDYRFYPPYDPAVFPGLFTYTDLFSSSTMAYSYGGLADLWDMSTVWAVGKGAGSAVRCVRTAP